MVSGTRADQPQQRAGVAAAASRSSVVACPTGQAHSRWRTPSSVSATASGGRVGEPVEQLRGGVGAGLVEQHHRAEVGARGLEQPEAVLLGPAHGALVRSDPAPGRERLQPQARHETARPPGRATPSSGLPAPASSRGRRATGRRSLTSTPIGAPLGQGAGGRAVAGLGAAARLGGGQLEAHRVVRVARQQRRRLGGRDDVVGRAQHGRQVGHLGRRVAQGTEGSQPGHPRMVARTQLSAAGRRLGRRPPADEPADRRSQPSRRIPPPAWRPMPRPLAHRRPRSLVVACSPVLLACLALLPAAPALAADPAAAPSSRPGQAAAATPDAAPADIVSLTAEPMLGGNVRPGSWMGVRVHVENDGPAIVGELRISGGQTAGIALRHGRGAGHRRTPGPRPVCPADLVRARG